MCVRALAMGLLRGRTAAPVMRAVRVDLNRASIGELMALPGIGRVRAEAIVLHRVRRGRFRRVEDLLRVDGIGPETFAGCRDFTFVEGVRHP